jgi:transposase
MKLHNVKRIIQLHHKAHLSLREIENALKKPKSTVADYIARFNKSGLTFEELEVKTVDEIYAAFFPEESRRPKQRLHKMLPDFAKIDIELKKKYITRELLWEEYVNRYPDIHYGYTHFCNLYKAWKKRISVSMRVSHKAGEKMFLDYSGLRWHIIDKITGEEIGVDVFVAALGASGYTFAHASLDQTKPSLITSTILAFEFFGGLTELIVPDNMKAAVTKADKYDPVINDTFQDMADHYGTIVFPARPYRAKDKPKVELSVKLVQRWILARLRHLDFFTLAELNLAIRDLLDNLNHRLIRRYGKSRYQLYMELDKPALKPLPSQRYRYREFKSCTVNIDYHVDIESSLYSVPYQLAGETVSAIYTTDSVEIFHNNKRIALHVRLYQKGAYSTKEEHMASAHRIYGTWSPSRLIRWGGSFGANTKKLIEDILASKPHPEMGFRSCMAILGMAKNHRDIEAVELTSKKMLELKLCKVAHFKEILKTKSYIDPPDNAIALFPPEHKNLRGHAYYR